MNHPESEPFEAAIFDLGGVVFGISLDPVIRSWAKAAGIPPEDIADRFVADSCYELFEVGEISSQDYRDHLCSALGIRLSTEDFDQGWNSIYLDLLPGIESLLKQLQKRLRLVALTNTNQIHTREWRARYSNILTYFEKVFASHEIGARKPDPDSFHIVLDYLDTDPGRVFFVDDNPENVNGAIAVGIKGFVATSPIEVAEELRQNGLTVLLPENHG